MKFKLLISKIALEGIEEFKVLLTYSTVKVSNKGFHLVFFSVLFY